jgi:ATP-dependent Clp protease ATP-binding subunit ClpA
VAKTKVAIYYGPKVGFDLFMGRKSSSSFLEEVTRRDQSLREHVHYFEGQDPPEEQDIPRIKRLVVNSSDYGSVNEHVITNFSSHVRFFNPAQLVLHNPPESIKTQLEQWFEVSITNYQYPRIDQHTLVALNRAFPEKIIGQSRVKEALLAATYPLTSGERVKPVVLMFYGPSGVGKTEVARLMNEQMSGVLMRKQFSMFQTERYVSYLFGGSYAEPTLTKDLLDRESGVVLLDEFDKAASVFHSAFYQLFDEGVLEDKHYRVNVGPTLIICTSNYKSEQEVREKLGEPIYSRFDALIEFGRLSASDLQLILKKTISEVVHSLSTADQKTLGAYDIEQLMSAHLQSFGNVRQLQKQVRQMVALILVRHLLAQSEAPQPERE